MHIFSATPHKGSDYAAVLNNILTISGMMSSRHYMTDITTGSISSTNQRRPWETRQQSAYILFLRNSPNEVWDFV